MKDCEFLEKYGSFLLPMFSLSVIPVNLDLLSSKNIKRNPVWGHMLAFSVTSELKAGGSPVLRDSRDDWITWIDPSENPNQDTNTEELKYYMVSSRNNQCNSCKLCSTMSSMIWSCATDSLLSEWEAPTCRAHSLPSESHSVVISVIGSTVGDGCFPMEWLAPALDIYWSLRMCSLWKNQN